MASPQVSPSQADFGQKTLSKISMILIPLLAVCYGINYMDRVNVGFAALQMNKDLHFTAGIYGFGAGVFFLGYAACEVPSNLLLTRFGARKWIARIMVTWGLVAAANGVRKKTMGILLVALSPRHGGGRIRAGSRLLLHSLVPAVGAGANVQPFLRRLSD